MLVKECPEYLQSGRMFYDVEEIHHQSCLTVLD